MMKKLIITLSALLIGLLIGGYIMYNCMVYGCEVRQYSDNTIGIECFNHENIYSMND
jgi:hypothetical protein